ncbi:hypothetical protein BCR44DRAFT_1195540 [Catenaria anguillulae PL171]|uniref:Uncharacterized protein n=1 Tax=Catenaria anguillulae PL171 TaxID=765915 RepID=A0A1Y2HGG1_9FUNG|nr:hypothetical protein BCR44DRAFT_1195540 [Catenaria anguillulae PL171]
MLDDLVLHTLPRKRLLSTSATQGHPAAQPSEHASSQPSPSTLVLLDHASVLSPGDNQPVPVGHIPYSTSLACAQAAPQAPRQSTTDASQLVPMIVKTASHAVSSCSFATESDESDAAISTRVISKSGLTVNGVQDSSTSSDLPAGATRGGPAS